ncbi:hypothetical protein CK203_018994 [Vitis vinifera]|uniref:Uncharacterized protein n=1 Tax=Vitis vinifera TaxID=29760 RepID=A0A438IQT1_VITVI|nr:hypothetical protein CK203_018994 [Vitis vinifera]
MNQVPLFSSARELANLVLSSNLIDCAFTKILELKRGQTALPVQYRLYQLSSKCTIVSFVSSPDCTQYPLPGQGDLDRSPLFDFLRTEEYPSVSINRAALALFTPLHDHLSGLTDEVKSDTCLNFRFLFVNNCETRNSLTMRSPSWSRTT